MLRGFTLCEILLAGIQLIANHGTAVVTRPMGDWDPWLGEALSWDIPVQRLRGPTHLTDHPLIGSRQSEKGLRR
ncbi:hypothetical protein [Streptosporangium sp. OZ121]|uniref:hypothetical protein n=1 Tax=Streptosporangium sp. OZ121 TaxID=3444183 RepID=UPI003F794392